jgi:hypothetical protein
MATLALPKTSKLTVVGALIAFGFALRSVQTQDAASLWLALLAFAVSGFLADLFTAFAHFGFDYIWPDHIPILGPVAKEFREHHDCPTLDPADYVENLSKGAYCSLPLSLLVLVLSESGAYGPIGFFALAILLGMSIWAFFFHQIHSYAHMGRCLDPEDFKHRVREISGLTNRQEQISEFEKLFVSVPIPHAIRLLQRFQLILDPKKHNFHHICFETDFSSVNGWSDPLANLVLRPFARRMKSRRELSPSH